MVYPHLDCKVGSRRTGWWPSGAGFVEGTGICKEARAAARFIQEKIEDGFRFQLHPRMEGSEATGNELCPSIGEQARFHRHSPGLAVVGLTPRRRKWNLQTRSPYSRVEANLQYQGM